MVRIDRWFSLRFIICVLRSLLWRYRTWNAVANDIHAFAALDDIDGLFRRVDIGNAAQRQRQRAALPGASQYLRLVRLQFERGGLADHAVRAVLFLGRLVAGQPANVAPADLPMDETRAA